MTEMMMKLCANKDFSVLISVYKYDKPCYLKEAIDSIIDQTLRPKEIVMIKDGPLTPELDNVINNFKKNFPYLFKIFQFPDNMGLGEALKRGLLLCKSEIIARMDSDDISMQDRFEKQVNFLKKNPEIDIVGSFIREFEGSTNNIIGVRTVPTTSDEIIKYVPKRNPLNHVTVVFRKNAVLKAGNYKNLKGIGYEDYHLWVRMLMTGAKFSNIPEVLVNVRAGADMIKRRGGIAYARNGWNFQIELLRMGFINMFEFVRNILYWIPISLMPGFFRKVVYKNFLRNNDIKCL